MRDILLRVPDELKMKLDQKRLEGYCQNAFINIVLARALADPPKNRTPRRKQVKP